MTLGQTTLPTVESLSTLQRYKGISTIGKSIYGALGSVLCREVRTVCDVLWSVPRWRIHLHYTITIDKKEQKVMHTYIHMYVWYT